MGGKPAGKVSAGPRGVTSTRLSMSTFLFFIIGMYTNDWNVNGRSKLKSVACRIETLNKITKTPSGVDYNIDANMDRTG